VKLEEWRGIGHNASEGIQPRNRLSSPPGQRLLILEASSAASNRASLCHRAGVKVHGRSFNGLWWNLGEPCRSERKSPNKPQRQGGGMAATAVGPTHSRGVVGVMPGAGNEAHSKGLAVKRRGR
jgi:hypothetical protein